LLKQQLHPYIDLCHSRPVYQRAFQIGVMAAEKTATTSE
jgi:hypothetical protein